MKVRATELSPGDIIVEHGQQHTISEVRWANKTERPYLVNGSQGTKVALYLKFEGDDEQRMIYPAAMVEWAT